MNIPLLSRQQLELINRRELKYPLGVAEKDYFLSLALKIIYDSPLKNDLVFKGGTALHHCYLPQYRFSEDLDFTSLNPEIRLEDLVKPLESSGMFTVKKPFQSSYTIKISRLWYEGILGQPGAIKIEVDYAQNVVLPAVARPYTNVWNTSVTPGTMDLVEIFAEKIRAASGRARYRDFYDLYFILTELSVSFEEALELLTKKELRYPISQKAILTNWGVAQEQQSKDLRTIFCSLEVDNRQIQELVEGLVFEPIMP